MGVFNEAIPQSYIWQVKINLGMLHTNKQGFLICLILKMVNKVTQQLFTRESTNSVVVHFGGFNDLTECKYFSHHIMDDLGIETY